MTVQFNIEYKAMFGEQIVVNIQTEEGELKLPLETTDGERWACDWCVESPEKSYTYYYSVEREGRAVKTEWLMIKHQLDVNAKKAAVYTLYDHWKVMPEDAYLYSSAFTDCINHQAPQEMKLEMGSKIVRLIVRVPQLRDGERLGVLGADKALGAWDVQKILPMTQHAYNEWVADIDATHLEGSHLEFKFVAFRNAKNNLLWETSMNRTVDLPEMKAGELVSYELDQAFFALYNRKLAGTQVPVFSLRTRKSAGIGDFGDLKTMIDFVASTGQKVLQLLPINDTTITHTWTDSYPYSCISVFAIHPQYADLHALPELKDAKARAEAEKTRAELNALDKIDYEKVNDFKINYLRQIFNQEGEKMMKTAEYKAFFLDTELWQFAKRKGWKLVRFCLRYDQIVRPGKSILIPEVTDFISLIANAGCVITDSFHGTAFCCNLNTPMICIYPNEFSSRLASLLQLTGLEQRHLKEYNDFSYVEKTNVDFERVNSILNQERAKGVAFLKNALEK